MAHNMTVLHKYRGAMMEVITVREYAGHVGEGRGKQMAERCRHRSSVGLGVALVFVVIPQPKARNLGAAMDRDPSPRFARGSFAALTDDMELR